MKMPSKDSRSGLSLKNSVIAFVFYAITLVLSFVSRKVFLDYLGEDILGLNSTIASLLGFLNLGEMGIGTAIAVTLYKPLFDKDSQSVSEIVSVQGNLYRRVAFFIIGGSLILMLFFPLIFKDAGVPIGYAYATYSVHLFNSLLGYFVNYKQVLLNASQQQYKVQYSYNTVQILKVICQILALILFEHPFTCWLTLEVLFSIFSAISLNKQINKTFPDIKADASKGSLYYGKYHSVVVKTKQLFVHKIGSFALNQSSPIIIYAFSSLAIVAMYGNYAMLTNGLAVLLSVVFGSMNAGIGNLVAEGNKEKIMLVFRELFSSRFALVSSCMLCIYLLSGPFITLWLGETYILDNVTNLLMCLLFFVRTSREVVESFINAYGLFQDTWAPLAEALINVGLSIFLGSKWGLPGVLAGVLMSQVIIIVCWKPVLLFRKGFQEKITIYVKLYAKHLSVFVASAAVTLVLARRWPISPASGIGVFSLFALVCFISAFAIQFVLLYWTETGFKHFIGRFSEMLVR